MTTPKRSMSTTTKNEMVRGGILHDKAKYSALIVDDRYFIRIVEQKMLDYYGFDTTAVENGQEAIDLFTAGSTFDAIFMDMEMPVKNGIEATKELRDMGVKSRIFGVTASESKSDLDAFKAAGLDECFDKPLTHAKMEIILNQLKFE